MAPDPPTTTAAAQPSTSPSASTADSSSSANKKDLGAHVDADADADADAVDLEKGQAQGTAGGKRIAISPPPSHGHGHGHSGSLSHSHSHSHSHSNTEKNAAATHSNPHPHPHTMQHGASAAEGLGLGGPGAGPPRRATMDARSEGTDGGDLAGRGLTRTFTTLLTPEHRLAPPPTLARSLRNIICYSWLNILLLFIPVSWALHFALPHKEGETTNDIIIFIMSFFAIVPLAALLSFGTEEISLRVGETLGGLLNATLGNAVELIVAIIALFQCQLTIVQTSLIGSVLSNILLVLGMCFFAGGIRYSEQTFQITAAQINSSLLVMAVITVLLPAGFHATLGGGIDDGLERTDILQVSRGVSVILLTIYLAYLFFTLSSHKHLFEGEADEEEVPQLSTGAAIGLLLVSTVLVGVTSEWLVDSINGVSESPGGPSKTWIGLILLPIVSNAAEHATAVTVAVKDKLDLSMGVAVGSSIQISIFVIPLLVVIGWIGNKPLTLLFDPFVAIFLFLAVLIVNGAIQDGKTNWLEGYLLMCVYIIAALIFWFVDNSEGGLFPDSQCT